MTPAAENQMLAKTQAARQALDAWTREMVQWHFNPETGCPFWLEYARKLDWDPRREVKTYDDLDRFGFFQDEWLRGGPVRRWVPKAYADRPIYTFETGGSTGVPKSRINIDDFRIDYEAFSEELPDEHFPRGSDWIMVGPSGPRRLRLAVEHLAQHRGGICFMTDLDPRWVIKLIKRGKIEEAEAYKQHVVEQALTLLRAHDGIRCMFTTPKLLEALCEKISLKKAGITGVFCGGTEMTPQFHRFAVEELLEGAYFAPTYGNTLMGLAVHKPRLAEDNYAVIYYPPAPRAMIEVVDPDEPSRVVEYGQTGRVRLTTLTREFFMPRFLERDEAEREPPYDRIPLGRRTQRAAVQPVSESRRRGRLLMAALLHVPILRGGQPYRSLDTIRTPHYRTREPFVEISQANVGLIRRDLRNQQEARAILAGFDAKELYGMCSRAAGLFAESSLPLGDSAQSPEDYVRQVSATTGLPNVMVRRNMQKIRTVMADIEAVVNGLTRNLDPEVFDAGYAGDISYFPRGDSLGVVLPSNSPGVHSLWIPAFAMKTPLVLKPGSAEPWTPYRIIQALIQAGAPPQVFGYYPADHAGGGEILRQCGRGMVFGDVSSTRLWQGDPRIEIHGPGYSKIVIGEDCIDDWEKYLDVMVASILENSGRSCINASGVWVPRHAERSPRRWRSGWRMWSRGMRRTNRLRSRRLPMPAWRRASRR